jgi:hypothetical protein
MGLFSRDKPQRFHLTPVTPRVLFALHNAEQQSKVLADGIGSGQRGKAGGVRSRSARWVPFFFF